MPVNVDERGEHVVTFSVFGTNALPGFGLGCDEMDGGFGLNLIIVDSAVVLYFSTQG